MILAWTFIKQDMCFMYLRYRGGRWMRVWETPTNSYPTPVLHMETGVIDRRKGYLVIERRWE